MKIIFLMIFIWNKNTQHIFVVLWQKASLKVKYTSFKLYYLKQQGFLLYIILGT